MLTAAGRNPSFDPTSKHSALQFHSMIMMMMILQLAKRIPKSLSTANHPLLNRFYSAPGGFKVVDYLINSCGLSPQKAAKISKSVADLKSPEKPDAILSFLKQQGFTEANIKTLITVQPKLLYSSPQNTLDPNLRALRSIGLSTSALTNIILSGPVALQLHSAVRRIQFWRDFLGTDEATLVKAFKHNRGLIGNDISKNIAPKLSLLQTHRLSTHDVRRIVLNIPQFITSSVRLIEDLLKRTKDLGFQPESKMFVHGLHVMASVSRDLLQKKMELLKSFGWSEGEFISALRMAPCIIGLSEENLKTKMHFLIGEVMCTPSYTASNPALLMYSLEKRLRPRHQILHLLESKGLSGQRRSFYGAITLTENKFVFTYILPHKKEVSGLHETYLSSCA